MNHETPSELLNLPTGADFDADEARAEKPPRAMPSAKDLPYDDGEPMDTPWHREQMNLLIHSLEQHWRDRTDFYVGGDMFVYYSLDQALNRDFRGPDFFVVFGVDKHTPRLSWVVWEEGGHAPDVIVEILSPTTAHIDRGVKMDVYARSLRTSEYFLYDPDANALEGWRLDGQSYARIAPEPDGRVWSVRLDLLLGPWDGAYGDRNTRWLRFFTRKGALVPTGEEAAVTRADAATARARAAAAKARAADAKARAADAARALAEAEIARLKQELDALRKQAPPSP